LFEIGEYFVPEMLISARAMRGMVSAIIETGAKPVGTWHGHSQG
jgi:hypothetical protein